MDLKKRVLLLGSGYVAAPAAEYLTLDPGTHVTVEPGERDMFILRNEVGVRRHGGELETHHAELLLFGEPGGHSALARTVGFPAAIVARMLTDGETERKGLVLPLSRNIYGPVLQ